MLTGIASRYGLKPHEIAMAGDRIYTDVATAQNAGAFGVLVLSGETTLDTALSSNPLKQGAKTDLADWLTRAAPSSALIQEAQSKAK